MCEPLQIIPPNVGRKANKITPLSIMKERINNHEDDDDFCKEKDAYSYNLGYR